MITDDLSSWSLELNHTLVHRTVDEFPFVFELTSTCANARYSTMSLLQYKCNQQYASLHMKNIVYVCYKIILLSI